MSYKEIWFREFERHLNELEGKGVNKKTAYKLATDRAEKTAVEKIDQAVRMAKDAQ